MEEAHNTIPFALPKPKHAVPPKALEYPGYLLAIQRQDNVELIIVRRGVGPDRIDLDRYINAIWRVETTGADTRLLKNASVLELVKDLGLDYIVTSLSEDDVRRVGEPEPCSILLN